MSNSEQLNLIRNLLTQERHGLLSTISQKHAGWPFGSSTPYAIAAAGNPLIFTSALAEHTRNFLHDPRVSLFVQDTNAHAQPQAIARATCLGVIAAVPADERHDAATIYLQRFPEAQQNFQLGDFNLYQINLQHVRYIGGFGQMFWAHF